MLGAEFIDTVANWDIQHQVGVEDFADRWNFLFTTGILIMCTVTVAARQYIVGEPITCFMPSEVSGSTFGDYMENVCWVQGTYPLPVDTQFTNSEAFWKSLESKKLVYYQWVPFILGLQTALFYLPRFVWLALASRRAGADSQALVARVAEAATSDGEEREKIVQQTAVDLEQLMLLSNRSQLNRGALSRLFGIGKRLSAGLTAGYLFVKLLYLANGIGQLYLMQAFLRLGASNYSRLLYGAEVLANIAAGRDWQFTMVFPRVTFCRAKFAILGGSQTYLAQCALPVNMLNEKIYIFLWFWIAVGILITALSLPAWLLRVASCRGRTRYVRRHLRLRLSDFADKPLVAEFVDRFLRHDGVFLLKMMQMNVGDLVTGDVVLCLYRLWLRKHREQLAGLEEALSVASGSTM